MMRKKTVVEYKYQDALIDLDRDKTTEPDVYLEARANSHEQGIDEFKQEQAPYGEPEPPVILRKGRRPSKLFLVNNLRNAVRNWRKEDYPGVTETTNELLTHWFFESHSLNRNEFTFWFCQREAIETLIYLFEVRKYDDIEPVINEYKEIDKSSDLIDVCDVKITEDTNRKRILFRYYPDRQEYRNEMLPPKGLLRYAFKMATGSGKTFVMALVIVWQYFNRLRENDKRFTDNFLVLAPNVIVYERLIKDFGNISFFCGDIPFVPKQWRAYWNLKVTSRGDDSPLNPSGNLIVNNIQQLYLSREKEDDISSRNIIESILGDKPQKDLTKPSDSLLKKIMRLDNLVVFNDEAHHVHDDTLKWNETLNKIHEEMKNGITLWLDFSATPKTQSGVYYDWIIVDYPLVQAIEDRIVKIPCIVHEENENDPERITKDNVVIKYSIWLQLALERWKQHNKVYNVLGKKPVLFIMAEKNDYADEITGWIRGQKKRLGLADPDEEVMVIHTTMREIADSESEIRKEELDVLRRLARDIDKPDNQVKIIVSNLMLREGWDVKSVTIILGLRSFSSQAEILPEQALGRGLRLMEDISPDRLQTLEAIGNPNFEEVILKLTELEDGGIPVSIGPPPQPDYIVAPEYLKISNDIELPQFTEKFIRNPRKISDLNPLLLSAIGKIEGENLVHYQITVHDGSLIDEDAVKYVSMGSGREFLTSLANSVMKYTHLTGVFNEIYPLLETYVLERCFERSFADIEDAVLKFNLLRLDVFEKILKLFIYSITNLTVEEIETVIHPEPLKLKDTEKFSWKRIQPPFTSNKTIFNYIAAYNNLEKDFALFLDRASDIVKFAILEGTYFKIDYIGERGAIRFYFPDFVAVQRTGNDYVNWIIETKGREFEDTENKDKAAREWCLKATEQSKSRWKYARINQRDFLEFTNFNTFEEIVSKACVII